MVAAKDVARRTRGLHRSKQAEVVLGVLKIVLAEDPVASSRSVAGELLIFLEYVLGVAANLRPFGAV